METPSRSMHWKALGALALMLIGGSLVFDLTPLGWGSGATNGVCIPDEKSSQEAGLVSCTTDSDCGADALCHEEVWSDQGQSDLSYCVRVCDPEGPTCDNGFGCLEIESPAQEAQARGCGGSSESPPSSSQEALNQRSGQALREVERQKQLLAHFTFDATTKLEASGLKASLHGAAVADEEIRGKVLHLPSHQSMLKVTEPINLGAEWTIMAWFKGLKSNGSWRTLTRGKNSDHQIIVQAGNTFLGSYANVGSPTGFRSSGFNTASLDSGAWHHVAAVGRDGETTFYVNGARVGQSDVQSTDTVYAIGNFQGGHQTFADYLDDLKIYSVAMSANDILDESTEGRKRLLAHYTFNESDAGMDTVGNADGALEGGATVVAESGRGPAMSVSSDAAVMRVATPAALNDNWTVLAWFKGIKPGGAQKTLLYGRDGARLATIGAASNLLGTQQERFVTSGFDISTLPNDRWHHLAVVGASASWANPNAVSAWSFAPCRGYQNRQVVQNMLDDNKATIWNAATCGNTTQWAVTFDLGESAPSGGVRMRSVGNGWHDPRHFDVHRCDDAQGTQCAVIRSCARTHGNDRYQACLFDTPVTARYFKITMKGWGRSGSTFHEHGNWQYYISDVQFRSAGGTTTFYIDGQLRGQSMSLSHQGLAAIGNAPGGGEAFADLIDEVKVYGSPLSERDILLDYNDTRRLETRGGVELGKSFVGKDLSGADLFGADYTGSDLTDADLTNANMRSGRFKNVNFSGATLQGADLTGADLTGADLSTAKLDRVKARDLRGCPASLPTGWKCVKNALLGPTADLSHLDLRGANLDGLDLRNAMVDKLWATALTACPTTPPNQWQCINNHLAGPSADLTDASFQAMQLASVSLADATLTRLKASTVMSCPTGLPASWRCIDMNTHKVLAGPTADLRGVNLKGADLENLSLSRATLTNANLEDVKIKGADLSGADLTGARLHRVKATALSDCRQLASDVHRCQWVTSPAGWAVLGPSMNLSDVDASGLSLIGLDLRGASLNHAVFNHADLTGARLDGARGSNTSYMGANLTRTTWAGHPTWAQGADFRGADLTEADLRDADFSRAIFRSAFFNATRWDDTTILTDADLRFTVLSGLDLSGLDLSKSFLSSYGKRDSHISPGQSVPKTEFGGEIVSEFYTPQWRQQKQDTFFGGGAITAHQLGSCPSKLPPNWKCLTTKNMGLVLIGPMANLSGVDLSGADLELMDLHGVDLSGANLEGARLLNVTLAGADLQNANLKNLRLEANEDFESATFRNNHLSGADLTGVDFQYGHFLHINDPGPAHFMYEGEQGTMWLPLGTIKVLGARGRSAQEHDVTRLKGCPAALPRHWRCENPCQRHCTSEPSLCDAACANFGTQLVYDVGTPNAIEYGQLWVGSEPAMPSWVEQPGHSDRPSYLVDIDGNGKLDYCRFVGPDGHLSCAFEGVGDHAFTSTVNVSVDPGIPHSATFKDVNRDGILDYCRWLGPMRKGEDTTSGDPSIPRRRDLKTVRDAYLKQLPMDLYAFRGSPPNTCKGAWVPAGPTRICVEGENWDAFKYVRRIRNADTLDQRPADCNGQANTSCNRWSGTPLWHVGGGWRPGPHVSNPKPYFAHEACLISRNGGYVPRKVGPIGPDPRVHGTQVIDRTTIVSKDIPGEGTVREAAGYDEPPCFCNAITGASGGLCEYQVEDVGTFRLDQRRLSLTSEQEALLVAEFGMGRVISPGGESVAGYDMHTLCGYLNVMHERGSTFHHLHWPPEVVHDARFMAGHIMKVLRANGFSALYDELWVESNQLNQLTRIDGDKRPVSPSDQGKTTIKSYNHEYAGPERVW